MHFKIKSVAAFLILQLSFATFSNAQIIIGATWNFSVEQKDNKEATLIITATIKDKFHIYSQFLSSNDGPIPTTFEFTANKNYELIDKVDEGKAEEINDEAFQMKLKIFEKTAVFKQKIKIISKEKFTVEGKLTFMACDNRMCLPPEDVPFSFSINKK
jgi:thiol:disulfide interchange protein